LAPGVSAAPLRTLCKPADAPVNAHQPSGYGSLGYELKIVGDLVTITRDATEQRF
jgi:hypothetical protein